MVTKNRNILAQASMLWPFISRRKKRDFYVYAFLTCISALADLMSIGILIPFIMVFLEPDRLLTFTVAKPVFGYFNLIELLWIGSKLLDLLSTLVLKQYEEILFVIITK